MPRTYLDIHLLQTVPPSNLNRDDTGSPKTAVYGGIRRARVSSQAWKRATRKAFADLLDSQDLGVRTKQVVALIAERVEQIAPDLADQRNELAEGVLIASGLKVTAPKIKKGQSEAGAGESGYLMFYSRRQVENLAELAVSSFRQGVTPDRARAKKLADSEHSVDIALVGRMVADTTDINVDAAAQVAHALSVHAVDNEFDYFTAMDDRNTDAEPGAGMIGTVEFNSSTLYRYATLSLDALQDNLGDGEATARAVEAFVRAFVTSMPTGKQNTFANRTLPDAVVLQARERQPVNLVGAFEEAVLADDSGSRLRLASERLARHSSQVDAAFGTTPLATLVVRVGDSTAALAAMGDEVGFDELVARAGALSRERAAVPV